MTTSPLPAHLTVAIRERIAVLRETWHLDEVYALPRPQDHPSTGRRPGHHSGPGATTPTFPGPHGDDVRRRSATFPGPLSDDLRSRS
jgi:hypothetical protein